MTAKEELNEYIAKLGLSPEMYSELMGKINDYTLHIAEKAVEDRVEKLESRLLNAFQLIKNGKQLGHLKYDQFKKEMDIKRNSEGEKVETKARITKIYPSCGW